MNLKRLVRLAIFLSALVLCLAATLLIVTLSEQHDAVASGRLDPVFTGIAADSHGSLYAITDNGDVWKKSNGEWKFDGNVVRFLREDGSGGMRTAPSTRF